MINLKVKKLHEDAIIPTYATDGSACFDLYAVDCADYRGLYYQNGYVFRTGLSFEIPKGYQMLVFSRSGHGFKNGVRLANCVGVIDSDYRGELMVKLFSDLPTNDVLRVSSGDRIAQAQILPVHRVTFIESDNLTETERGAGGFGSTGA